MRRIEFIKLYPTRRVFFHNQLAAIAPYQRFDVIWNCDERSQIELFMTHGHILPGQSTWQPTHWLQFVVTTKGLHSVPKTSIHSLWFLLTAVELTHSITFDRGWCEKENNVFSPLMWRGCWCLAKAAIHKLLNVSFISFSLFDWSVLRSVLSLFIHLRWYSVTHTSGLLRSIAFRFF